MCWRNGVAYKGAYSLILSSEYAAEQQDTGQSLAESNLGGKTTKRGKVRGKAAKLLTTNELRHGRTNAKVAILGRRC